MTSARAQLKAFAWSQVMDVVMFRPHLLRPRHRSFIERRLMDVARRKQPRCDSVRAASAVSHPGTRPRAELERLRGHRDKHNAGRNHGDCGVAYHRSTGVHTSHRNPKARSSLRMGYQDSESGG